MSKLAYTYAEAAEAVGCSVSKIRQLVRESHLVATTPQGTTRPVILASELEAWLASGDQAA